MMNASYLADSLAAVDYSIADAKTEAKQRKKQLRLKAKLLQTLEYETGVEMCNSQYSFSSTCRAISVTLGDLHAIKKIVGPVVESGTDIPHDYKETNELLVTVKPESGLYDMLTFQYRKRHLSTDKCKVKTITSESYSYETLVCPTEE